ncbi:MAG: hypothetical protein N3A38_15200 [Planctomycetota bacterium]|nr:hypothetical protein [Planctomycetota bacterium]
MTRGITITREVHFRQGRGQRKVLAEGRAPEGKPLPLGRVPRVSRLMALAIRLEKLVRSGEVADYADIARLGHVTRARVTQIMSLLNLAPDIQEEILFLPRTEHGRDPIRERHLRPIAAVMDWRKQRKMWQAIKEPRAGPAG